MTSSPKLKIVYRQICDLKPYADNARTHSDKQIRQIAESIKTFGWTNPILVDKDLTVLAGHGRLAAAHTLGLDKVPTILVTNLTAAQKKAYILADNKIAEKAGWDKDILSAEFKVIAALDANFNFDATGFAAPAVDFLLSRPANDPDAQGDDLPQKGAYTISRRGDLWLLGDHRLYCGDAREAASYKKILGDVKAGMVFTDPPYNVPIKGFASGHGRPQHDDFAMGVGEMSEAAFVAFLKTAMALMSASSRDGALHYVCMDWRHIYEIMAAAREIYAEQKNLCVWNKANAGMGSFYRSKHELIFVFKHGTAASINNIALGKAERYRTNVWDYPGASCFSKTRNADLAAHPTVKPVTLIADAILDASRRGDVILDPFAGSGTTILAAAETGRKAAAIEIEGAYVDLAIRRYEAASGVPAKLAGANKTFAAVADERTHWSSELIERRQ